MGRYQKLVQWNFNHALWSASMATIIEQMGVEFMAEYLGLSESILNSWARGRYAEGFQHPSMSNFLKVCDSVDLDPSEFFVLGDVS
jgi:hypothetical protein